MAGHKHAALMAEYAKDAAETERPWERWEHDNGTSGEIWSEFKNSAIGPSWFDGYQYRRKPKTITISGREIQPPLDQVRHKQKVYASDAAGRIAVIEFNAIDLVDSHEHALGNGRLFATPEAAKAAYDAITALLVPGG